MRITLGKRKMKTAAPGKTYRTKLGKVVVHIGRTFSLVSFPPVKWKSKNVPVEWRN